MVIKKNENKAIEIFDKNKENLITFALKSNNKEYERMQISLSVDDIKEVITFLQEQI